MRGVMFLPCTPPASVRRPSDGTRRVRSPARPRNAYPAAQIAPSGASNGAVERESPRSPRKWASQPSDPSLTLTSGVEGERRG
jgi:hypothetical protein